MRSEDYKLHQGLGFFRIIGGRFGTGLYFDGKPISFYWPDCRGSVAQYLAKSNNLNFEPDVEKIRRFVAGNVNPDKKLASQLKPLLKLFDTGDYKLELSDLKHFSQLMDETNAGFSQEFDDFGGFYPDGEILIASQPTALLNFERIEYYEKVIARGDRPIVLLASTWDAWADFVIDGHHKLQAYIKLKIPPRFLRISKQSLTEVADLDVANFLSNYPEAARHFRSNLARIYELK